MTENNYIKYDKAFKNSRYSLPKQ